MVINLMSIINNNNMETLKIGIAILFITFIFVIGVIIYLSDSLVKNKIKIEEQRYINIENEVLEHSLKNLNRLYEENSKSFHEFNHHIGALNIMLENNQYDKMKKYISEINMINKYKPER